MARPVFTGSGSAGDAGAGRGHVLVLPQLAFRTEPEEAAAFLAADAAGGERKNTSLDPSTGRIGNTTLPLDAAARLARMIDRFGRSAERLRCFPDMADAGQQYGCGRRAAGVARRRPVPGLRPPLPGSAWPLQKLGIAQGRRNVYDHIMLQLHDAGKLDAAYGAAAPRRR